MEIQLLECQNGVYPLPLQPLYHQSEPRENSPRRFVVQIWGQRIFTVGNTI